MPQTDPVEEVKVQGKVSLHGRAAHRVRRIAEREGNPVSTVLRRLVSVGLAHEPADDEEEWV